MLDRCSTSSKSLRLCALQGQFASARKITQQFYLSWSSETREVFDYIMMRQDLIAGTLKAVSIVAFC